MLSPGCGVGGAELSADGHLPADLDQMAAEDDKRSLWRAEGAGINPNFTSGSQYLFSKPTPGPGRQLPVTAS